MKNIYLIDILQYMLETVSISGKRKDIYKVLFSDPNYPSLASISTTLSYFGVGNSAFLSDIEHLNNYKNILIHTQEDDGHFYIIREISNNNIVLYDGKDIYMTVSRFREIWDGVVLVMNKNTNFSYIPVNDHQNDILISISFIAIVLYCLLTISNNFILTFLLDIIGIICAYTLLKQQVYDFEKPHLCIIGKQIDCNYVAQMNPLSRWIPFGLPIIGVYYFLFDSIYIVTQKSQSTLLFCMYVVATLFMLSLTLYQILKIKRYCLYCISIAAIILLKLVIIKTIYNTISIEIIINFLILTIFVYCICGLFYHYMIRCKNCLNEEIALLKIKRNDKIIHQYFDLNKRLSFPINTSLIFGNINAKISITTVINLSCKHCGKIILEMNKLMKKFPDKFLWQLVIDGNNNPENSDLKFVHQNYRQLYLYTIYKKDKNKCLTALLRRNFKENIPYSKATLLLYRELLFNIRESTLEYYPTVLINDVILPHEYQINDIEYVNINLFKIR